jgi:hypothetical protein
MFLGFLIALEMTRLQGIGCCAAMIYLKVNKE